jgi:hypothetical protein
MQRRSINEDQKEGIEPENVCRSRKERIRH